MPTIGGTKEIAAYRLNLAENLLYMRTYSRSEASDYLREVRREPAYQIARALHQNPMLFTLPDESTGEYHDEPNGSEQENFGYYRSNEYYVGLADHLRELRGVGISVGSDQSLDFFTMANLNEVYAVDIDPHIHTVTRAYLEIGLRFHKRFDRYPTTDEYLQLFNYDNLNVTLGVLASQSAGYNFSKSEIEWIKELYASGEFGKYLKLKRDFYRSASWIGSDENLAKVIQAYEQGRIKISTGSVTGDLIPTIAQEVSAKGKRISLVYISNAPIQSEKTMQRLKLLPLSDHPMVIFSQFGTNSRAQVPRGYNFSYHWGYYVFSPLEHHNWPTDRERGIEAICIGNGCYYLRPKVNLVQH